MTSLCYLFLCTLPFLNVLLYLAADVPIILESKAWCVAMGAHQQMVPEWFLPGLQLSHDHDWYVLLHGINYLMALCIENNNGFAWPLPECFSNGTMSALAVKVESVPHLVPRQLTLRDPKCQPKFSNDRFAYFSFEANSCGTTRTVWRWHFSCPSIKRAPSYAPVSPSVLWWCLDVSEWNHFG